MSNNPQVYSTQTLIKASVLASVAATLIVVCLVLPAEYNVDPTGIGKSLGLTQLATTSNNLVEDKRSHEVEVIVPAGRGIEYKLLMEKYAHITYQWHTVDEEPLYFDFHGEPRGDTTGYFESFSITTSSNMKGSLTTPFVGSHGWYWKNNSDKDVVVKLLVTGDYTIKG